MRPVVRHVPGAGDTAPDATGFSSVATGLDGVCAEGIANLALAADYSPGVFGFFLDPRISILVRKEALLPIL